MEIGNLYSGFKVNAGEKSAAAQRAQIAKWREMRRENREVGKLSAADTSGTQNQFERVLNTYAGRGQSLIGELADQAGSEMGVKADYFEQYLNKMTSSYGEMRDVMEEIYSLPDSEKEYYVSYDSDGTKLRFPKQITSEIGKAYGDNKTQAYPGFLSAVSRGSSSFFGRVLGNLCNWLGL